MTDSFANRLSVVGSAVTADLPDGARLAVELRDRLVREGHPCEEVFADEDGWCFFVATQQAPVCVLLLPTSANGSIEWQATAQYEGGLSSIWSEQSARHGVQLAARIQAVLNEYLAARRAATGPSADPNPV